MTIAVLDDHLLRDVLAVETGRSLRGVTHLHAGNDESLSLPTSQERSERFAEDSSRVAGRRVADEHSRTLRVPDEFTIVPMASIVARMAELASDHRVSTLGAEAVAAAEHLDARLCVWSGDDGPGIRACATAIGVRYQTVRR